MTPSNTESAARHRIACEPILLMVDLHTKCSHKTNERLIDMWSQLMGILLLVQLFSETTNDCSCATGSNLGTVFLCIRHTNLHCLGMSILLLVVLHILVVVVLC
jgi:hypothetical protein